MGDPLKNGNGSLSEKTTQELMEFLEKDIFGKEEAEVERFHQANKKLLIRFWRNWKDEMKTRQREKTS